MKSVRRPSAVPLYGIAAVWLVYTLLFGMSSAPQIILCAAISAAAYLLLKTIFPGKTEQVEVPEKAPDTGDTAVDQAIVQGRESLREIRRLNAGIPDARVTAQLAEIETLTRKIFEQLEAHKDKLPQCRRFLDYYLPTTVKLVRQYADLRGQGLKDGNVAEAMKKIEEMLGKVTVAYRKQLDSLFASDVVDITADIAVMEQMMAAQGLTGQEDFKERS